MATTRPDIPIDANHAFAAVFDVQRPGIRRSKADRHAPDDAVGASGGRRSGRLRASLHCLPISTVIGKVADSSGGGNQQRGHAGLTNPLSRKMTRERRRRYCHLGTATLTNTSSREFHAARDGGGLTQRRAPPLCSRDADKAKLQRTKRRIHNAGALT